jgi:hypothetical protein
MNNQNIEKIDLFVEAISNTFNGIVASEQLKTDEYGRSLCLLVKQGDEYGVSDLINLPENNPILGLLIIAETEVKLETQGYEIICGAEAVVDREKNTLNIRFSSKVEDYDKTIAFPLDITPKQISDNLTQGSR